MMLQSIILKLATTANLAHMRLFLCFLKLACGLGVIEFLITLALLLLLLALEFFLLALLLFKLSLLSRLHLLAVLLSVGLILAVLSKRLDHVIDHLTIAIEIVDSNLDNQVLLLADEVGDDSSRPVGHGSIDDQPFESFDLDFALLEFIHAIAQRLFAASSL